MQLKISTIQENYVKLFNFKLKLNTVFANFGVYLLKESTSSRQDLNKLVTNIPDLFENGEFKRLYQHQSSVCWKNYCHLSLLFLNGNKMSKICKFQRSTARMNRPF